ncbi:MAG: hypothetical protein K6B73_07565 [Treponema sp.]|nr:hypothetical protein [Treponema sp.]
MLLNTLFLQEAKDSSEVENIVTTQDEVYQADLDMVETITKAAQKEVLRYRQAIPHQLIAKYRQVGNNYNIIFFDYIRTCKGQILQYFISI